MGLVDGVTTNPSLVAKTGRKFRDVLVEICDVVKGPVSAEVVSTTHDEMMKEARELAALRSNVVVKIPLIPEGLKAVRTCTDEGIKTNVTLCFSSTQALLAAKAGATYISPFVGRLDDAPQQRFQAFGQTAFRIEHIGQRCRESAMVDRHLLDAPFQFGGAACQLGRQPLQPFDDADLRH